MFTHEPGDYICPFCALLAGEGDEYSTPEDIVYRDTTTTALIAPKWWPHNPGSVLVIPNMHYENIYSISDEALSAVYKTVKRLSIAIRQTYNCEGTSNRQHNEPAGRQNVWHFHVHIFPRYTDDKLYERHEESQFVDPTQRETYAEKLRAYFVREQV